MFEHSTDDELRHVYKNILLQSKTSTARADFRQENCYINSYEIELNILGMPRHARPHPTKTLESGCSFHIYLTTCKNLTSYLNWFLRYKSLQILKPDWRISFWTANQKPEFYQVWGLYWKPITM